jgi:hypothetical protein
LNRKPTTATGDAMLDLILALLEIADVAAPHAHHVTMPPRLSCRWRPRWIAGAKRLPIEKGQIDEQDMAEDGRTL